MSQPTNTSGNPEPWREGTLVPVTPLNAPTIREARHKVLYWMMGSNTDSAEATERNGKLLDTLVTALCAWQRAQDIKELRTLADQQLVVGLKESFRYAADHLEALK